MLPLQTRPRPVLENITCVKAAMEATLVGQEFISNLHLSTSAYSSLKM